MSGLWWLAGRGWRGQARLAVACGAAAFFGAGLWAPSALALSPPRIYWGSLGVGGRIGEATLDGSAVNPGFVTVAATPEGVAVDGQHIYWANGGDGTIGEANLDGTFVNQSLVTGADEPVGVAVSVPVAQLSPLSP